MSINSQESCRSWFCVLNNPEKIFKNMTPLEMVEEAMKRWYEQKPDKRACAVNYEIGDKGTPHMHMVLEDSDKSRFSSVQKSYPGVHIEPTKGTKQQAEDYIEKKGGFLEKEHTVVVPAQYYGIIKGRQGYRSDLEKIDELIDEGYTRGEICDTSIKNRRFSHLVKDAFFSKKKREQDVLREMKVFYHFGISDPQNQYDFMDLVKQYGKESIYRVTDVTKGCFDLYDGEKVLFIKGFEHGISMQQLTSYLDGYQTQIHCRYSNSIACWDEVHLASIYSPEDVYNFMLKPEYQKPEAYVQWLNLLGTIIYHYEENGHYKKFIMSGKDYVDSEDLKRRAEQ